MTGFHRRGCPASGLPTSAVVRAGSGRRTHWHCNAVIDNDSVIESDEATHSDDSVDGTAALSAPGDLASESSGDLLRLYGDILVELRRRGVIRSENSPVGDVAELLAQRALHLEPATNSASGYDGTDEAGVRYQIKGRRLTKPGSPRQLGAIRGPAEGLPDPFRTFSSQSYLRAT